MDEGPSLRPEDLVERYQRRIYSVIYRMVGRHSDADDLCQETFLQIFRSLSGFRPGTNLDAWVYRIAMNVSVDHLRQAGKSRRMEEQLRRSGTPAGTGAEALPEETVRQVRQAVEKLPPEQKAVVVLRMFEGLSHEKISEIVDAPVATVRWRFFASLEKLESLLQAQVERPGDTS